MAALRRPAMVVLNACPAGRTLLSRFGENHPVRDARPLLDGMGVAVADTALGDRLTYRSAIITGQAASELEPGGKAARDIAALWSEIINFLEGSHEQAAIVA